jgi:hypothetical protein
MADNKESRDNRDRSRVAGDQEYELRHIAEKMNVSTEEVRRAIESVGNDRQKVEEFLQRKGNR